MTSAPQPGSPEPVAGVRDAPTDGKPGKFVVVLRRDLPAGRALNVCGHLCLGLTQALLERHGDTVAGGFVDYPDATGGHHRPVSSQSLIILSAKVSWMGPFRAAVHEHGLSYVDYTDLMIEGDFRQQQAAMARTAADDLAYLGVAAWGSADDLDPLTRRFSLWR